MTSIGSCHRCGMNIESCNCEPLVKHVASNKIWFVTEEAQQERKDNSGEFRKELESLINRYSRENASNTPDHILMNFMWGCLCAFDQGTRARDNWYGVKLSPGQSQTGGDCEERVRNNE